MKWLVRIVVSAIVVGGGAGCEKSSKQDGASTNAPSAASAPLAQTSAAPSAGTSTGASTGSAAPVCPFPKRCTQACKDAHSQGVKACEKEAQLMQDAPNAEKFGKCNAACITHQDQCIGAATSAECSCAKECEKDVTAEMKAKFEPFAQCYGKAVIAACQ